MLETLYSSGVRRMELVHLCLYDVDTRGGSLTVREGKGGRDRVVPLGARAAIMRMTVVRRVTLEIILEGGIKEKIYLTGKGYELICEKMGVEPGQKPTVSRPSAAFKAPRKKPAKKGRYGKANTGWKTVPPTIILRKFKEIRIGDSAEKPSADCQQIISVP